MASRDAKRILALMNERGLGTSAFPPAGGRRRAPEPVVVRHAHTSQFGTILGQQSIAELQDFMTSVNYRMRQLGQAYANFSPTWVKSDPPAFIDWTNDWNALQSRVNAAMSSAQTAVTMSKVNPAPASMIAAQSQFDGLLKAMKQNAPPDGAPIRKGDFDDLSNRLQAAGHAPDYSQMPQPSAPDADLGYMKTSAPVVPVAKGIIGVGEGVGGILQGIGNLLGGGDKKGPSTVKLLFLGGGMAVGGLFGGIGGAKLGSYVGNALIGGLMGVVGGAALAAGAVEMAGLGLSSAPKPTKGGVAKSLLAA